MSSTAIQTDNHDKLDQYSKDVPWYHKEIQDFSPACRELLENYSHIPAKKVDTHVLEIREKAWSLLPYPCIGGFRFLTLSISLQPRYPRVLSFLLEPQSQHTLLDLGCCFAQDIRKLAHDGVPSENLYACDLEQSFLDLSYDLFNDRDKMRGHLFTANAMEENSALDKLRGKIDIVYTASFLHLFGWDDQLMICKSIIKTLKPRKGSLVFGKQTGNVGGQEVKKSNNVGRDPPVLWRHDVESFRKMWDVASQETGTRWKTWGELDKADFVAGHEAEEGFRTLRFEVERVE